MNKPILDITNDIQSPTTVRRPSRDFLKQLEKSRRPVVLRVKGTAAVSRTRKPISGCSTSPRELMWKTGLGQGGAEVGQERACPAREPFDSIRRKHGVGR